MWRCSSLKKGVANRKKKKKQLHGKIIVKKKINMYKSVRPHAHALCRHSSYYSEQKATKCSRNLAWDGAGRSDRVD